MEYVVTKDAMRPASSREECFYCNQPIGEHHDEECVLVVRDFKVKLIVERIVSMPNSWTNEDVVSYIDRSFVNEMESALEDTDASLEVQCVSSGDKVSVKER